MGNSAGKNTGQGYHHSGSSKLKVHATVSEGYSTGDNKSMRTPLGKWGCLLTACLLVYLLPPVPSVLLHTDFLSLVTLSLSYSLQGTPRTRSCWLR